MKKISTHDLYYQLSLKTSYFMNTVKMSPEITSGTLLLKVIYTVYLSLQLKYRMFYLLSCNMLIEIWQNKPRLRQNGHKKHKVTT